MVAQFTMELTYPPSTEVTPPNATDVANTIDKYAKEHNVTANADVQGERTVPSP